jgi:hypothetical protein
MSRYFYEEKALLSRSVDDWEAPISDIEVVDNIISSFYKSIKNYADMVFYLGDIGIAAIEDYTGQTGATAALAYLKDKIECEDLNGNSILVERYTQIYNNLI